MNLHGRRDLAPFRGDKTMMLSRMSFAVGGCVFLFACASETPAANDPTTVAPAFSAPPTGTNTPPPCASEPAKQEFDTVLKGAVAMVHRHCPYVVEAEVSSPTGGVFDHIVRPTPDEVMFQVCAVGRRVGEGSCAPVLAPRTVAAEVPDMKQGDRLRITGRSMDVKGIWVLDATKIRKAE